MDKNKIRIAVFVSGGGTNLQAILDAQQAGIITAGEVVVVISNKQSAYAIERAKKAGVKTCTVTRKQTGSQEAFEKELLRVLKEEKIELIVLAGFMNILSADFTSRFANRMINIHPALLPAFGGQGFYGIHVHEAALKAGVKVTGATVHYVNEVTDGGEIISQKAVEVKEGDTPELLQKRVMEEAEWVIYPIGVQKVCEKLRKEKKMDVYQVNTISERLQGNTYPGRGIIAGVSADAKKAVCAYFIMGRSANSRNRIFTNKNGAIYTEPFDASKVEDPSLIIYAAVRQFENKLIVTNGDQTDTIYTGYEEGKSMTKALTARCFEPDGPNWTPRISAVLTFDEDDSLRYEMSILKSIDLEGSDCARYTFSYPKKAGLGHFIHTYVCDGNPIPTFQGEPERISIPDDIDAFTDEIWNALDPDNKISLYVRYTDLDSKETEERLINKNSK